MIDARSRTQEVSLFHNYTESARQTLVALGLLAAVLAVAASIAWCWLHLRGVRAIVDQNEAGRVQSLDGLRAILALSVMLHHGFLMHGYFLHGVWDAPKNTFNEVLGRGAVAIFFMITAFLFWSRAINAAGSVNARRLYISRFRRIAPAFVATIAVTTTIILSLSGFRLLVPFPSLAISVARHLAFGISIFTPINRFGAPFVLDGVTWSLGYEVAFYVTLPLLAILIRLRQPWIAPVVVFIAANAFHAFSAVSFIPGIVAAEIAARPKYAAWFSQNGSKILILALTMFVIGLFAEPNYAAIRKPQLVILAIIFLGVVFTPTISILRKGPLLLLGTISYSIYLLHSLALFMVLQFLQSIVPISKLSTLAYWSVVMGCVAGVVSLALASYVLLERPFMPPSKKVRVSGEPLARHG